VKQLADDPQHAFPRPRSDEAGGVGDRAAQARGCQAESRRDILKKAAAYFAKEIDMKFGFVAKHGGSGRRNGCAGRSVSRGVVFMRG